MNKLSELKAAAMAATPGPWILDDDSWSEGDNANVSTEERYDGRIVSIAQIEGGGSESGFDEPFSAEQQANARYKLPDGWIACSERMPEVGERDWRTAFPVLVKCEIGVIPAYYGFTYHEGEQCFGFMESIKFGDASGSGPEQHENRLMMHVTHWMPLPAAPEGGNG